MKYSSSSILLERAQRMKVNRIGKLFSSLKTIINGLFSCLSLKWSLIFNAISVFMQITCKQLIGLVYVWLFISLLPFSSYCPAEMKLTAIIHSLIEKVLEMHLKVWTLLQTPE